MPEKIKKMSKQAVRCGVMKQTVTTRSTHEEDKHEVER